MNTAPSILDDGQTAVRQQQISELKPIDGASRIDVMDILRGAALLGILLMNIEWFNRSITEIGRFDRALSGADWSVGWLIRLLVEGKFIQLFALLFGMGFAVMLLRAKQAGRPFGAWFSRRMMALFLFGCAHMVLLWPGDIIHDYAVAGMMLLGWVYLLELKWMQWANKPNGFFRVGMSMLLFPFVLILFMGVFFGVTNTYSTMKDEYRQDVLVAEQFEHIKQMPELAAPLIAQAIAEREGDIERETVDTQAMSDEQLIDYKAQSRFIQWYKWEQDRLAQVEAFTQGSYRVATEYRLGQAWQALMITPVMALFLILPLFMIGYWLVASEIIVKPKQHLGLFKAMAWVGTTLGLIVTTAGLTLAVHPVAAQVREIEILLWTLVKMGQILMAAGYLGLIVLAFTTEWGQRWLSWLAPMGRMALTNYIAQSLILSSIFYGYAGGMFGEISRLPQMGIVLGIILGQAIFCHLWLRYFKFGPLEWLWRSMTYMKMQPIWLDKKG